MEYKDYYKIMGVERHATPDELKKAHRKLARKYHPDVSQEKDAEAHFKDISEAYEVLRDPEKRAAYDQLGRHWKAGQDFRPPPDWNAGTEHPGRGFEWAFAGDQPGQGADFSDFFESLFSRGFATPPGRGTGAAGAAGNGRSRRQAFSSQGEDQHAKIMIDLEDVYSGAAKKLSLRVPQLDAQGRRVEQTHQISFDVPKGIRAGQHIRLTGQGSPGTGGGPPGDLYLEVAFRPRASGSPNYRVDKHDVYLDLPITPWEAALGAEVQAPTPSGTVEVKIPPASSSGRKLRLKGRGIPGSTPGDFYFVLQLVTPPAQTDSDKSFYNDMARQFKVFKPRGDWDQRR
jgi:curved DNA-binding protein